MKNYSVQSSDQGIVIRHIYDQKNFSFQSVKEVYDGRVILVAADGSSKTIFLHEFSKPLFANDHHFNTFWKSIMNKPGPVKEVIEDVANQIEPSGNFRGMYDLEKRPTNKNVSVNPGPWIREGDWVETTTDLVIEGLSISRGSKIVANKDRPSDMTEFLIIPPVSSEEEE